MEFELTQEFVDEWNRIRAKVDGMTGPGIQNTHSTLTHSPTPQGADGNAVGQILRYKIIGTIDNSGIPAVGRYTAHLFYGQTNNDPSDLQESDLGKLATKTVELWNPQEILGAGKLQAGQYGVCYLIGFNQTTGQPIYEVMRMSLPPGTGIYKVLQLIDNLDPGTPGFDYPKFN